MSESGELAILILAAGKGTRMKSRLPKVLHPICGRPMLHYPLAAAESVRASQLRVVVGHEADQATLTVSDSTITMPGWVAPALRYVAEHDVLTPRQLPELSESSALVLVRRLIRDGMLMIDQTTPAKGKP